MKVFKSAVINGMSLANRFVRSATWEGMATDDGYCSPELTQLLVRLARGNVGLIISSHSNISPTGLAGIRQVGVWSDDFIPQLTELTRQIHEASGKIVMQLNHAGNRTATELTNTIPMGPTAFKNSDGTVSRTMEKQDIDTVVEQFTAAAHRVQQAGFDGVQIHAAHGYLLSSFLSPYFNKRTDEYGGNAVNRARFLLEVLQAVRAAVGNNFPVLVKMNAADFLPGGLTAEDMVTTALLLEKASVDAIELSGGTPLSEKCIPFRSGKHLPEREGYYREEARQYKEKVTVPLILVGGFRSLAVSEKFLQEGICDFIALCRPLIREPELIRRWQEGNTAPSECISDNRCFVPIRNGQGLYCFTKERHHEER